MNNYTNDFFNLKNYIIFANVKNLKIKEIMKAMLNSGTTIKISHPMFNLELNETTIFTDVIGNNIILYDKNGNKLYFPDNHVLSGCGFPETLFDEIKIN
jgi:hypothetical protein